MSTILEIKNLTKKFGSKIANDRVSISVETGEVRALLGENGAGKSTLMSCLYGHYLMDRGEIYVDGKKMTINSCQDAIEAGIGMINQHFMLVQRLTVAENVMLGFNSDRKSPWLETTEVVEKIREISDSYHFNIDPYAKIEDLSLGMQQRVEILKILFRHSRIMIFDEPTAVLTPGEIEDFFKIIKRFKSENKTIIFITHKLNEVMEICDSVTVLRDGHVVGNVKTRDTEECDLANLMVGREITLQEAQPAENVGDMVLEVRNLFASDSNNQVAVKDISFSVASGEILGIAGVDGNGQMELGKAITGMHKIDSGQVLINGTDTTSFKPDELLLHGMSYIPADRHKTGLILDFTVAENLASREIGQERFSRKGFLRQGNLNNHSRKLIGDFDIRGAESDTPAKHLSGGNQQKIVIAREFDRKPRLIVAIQPTRGLDISAVEFVRSELIKKRNEGAAILLISTELEEVMAMSDRIKVIYEGEFTGSHEGHQAELMELGLQMAGKQNLVGVCEADD